MRKSFVVLFLFVATTLFGQDPDILYLTWVDNPSTTMTVMWHVATGYKPHKLSYKRFDETEWHEEKSTVARISCSSIDVYRSDLEDLSPDTDYLFRLDDGPLHRFRTLPNNLDQPLKIAVGGDAFQVKEVYMEMNETVASADPACAIVAGDIAYSEGLSCALRTHQWRVERWEEFFRLWTKQMIGKNNRMIPLVSTLGNHDVKEGFDNPNKEKVLYYQVFPLPKKGIPYQLFKIGNELSFYLLDSGHSYPVGGAQTEWLEQKLEEEKSTPYNIPVYHIGAYPSETAYSHRGSKDVRKFWVPLFEKYGVKVAMEHDNHTFKRTFPIWEGKVDHERGILYLGDGSWGVTPLKPKRHWYLQKAAQANCYWLLTASHSEILFEAFNEKGQKIDQLIVSPN